MPQVVARPRSTVAVTIRDVAGADELRACQELQRTAWGITEDGYVVPVATMAGVQKAGGVILGAFDNSTRLLVGFAFAFVGKLHERYILYSQLTGVDPALQSSGIGRLLKHEQCRRAKEMALEAVVWAFDPLQASNAAFNLGVLGASCRNYVVDMYGSRSDILNAGLATDRLLAEWSTADVTAGGHSALWFDGVDLVETKRDGPGPRYTVARVRPIPVGATHLHIRTPASIADLKAHAHPSVAREWQLAVRESFEAAFAAGFVAIGFSRADPEQPCYLLERAA